MKRRRRVRLELTPLIDVMFLVLVFFIYSICEMAVHRGVKVDLPDTRGDAERGEPRGSGELQLLPEVHAAENVHEV